MTTLNITEVQTRIATKETEDKKEEKFRFYNDVLDGLRSKAKYLPSKYFYDEIGDKIFQEIMNCEEYYPFNCELEVFREHSPALAQPFMSPSGAFDLIELGAGDCTKCSYLLNYLVEIGADFSYMPIDISSNTINYLEMHLPIAIPGLRISGLNGEYFEMLESAAKVSENRKIVLFLGSNLGNMLPGDAEQFCRELRRHLKPGDLAMIGLDLKKSPDKILAAYNDKEGITRRFNLNLLKRINRELGANFDLSKFAHFPVYDPQTGACKSYLISLSEQEVTMGIQGSTHTFYFPKDEAIFMEISQKYTIEQVKRLGEQAGFMTLSSFFDANSWFMDTIWQVV